MKYAIYDRKSNRLVCRVSGSGGSWQITDNETMAKSLDAALFVQLLPSFGEKILVKDESIEMEGEDTEAQPNMPAPQDTPPPVSTEQISQRVEPAVKVLKQLLERAEAKRKERDELLAHQQALVLEQQNAMAVPEKDGLYYVTMDGDGIGNKVARAQFMDDENMVREISRKIDGGKDLFIQWALNYGGIIIEAGGDEGQAKVSSSALEHIEEFRENYKKQVGATVTVGVGETISQSIQARELGKLRGKNQVVYWDGNSEKELELRLKQKGPESTEQKIHESGVLAEAPLPVDQPKLGQSPPGPARARFTVTSDEFEANSKAQQEYEAWLNSQKRELAGQ